jgi:hypothetical protein
MSMRSSVSRQDSTVNSLSLMSIDVIEVSSSALSALEHVLREGKLSGNFVVSDGRADLSTCTPFVDEGGNGYTGGRTARRGSTRLRVSRAREASEGKP